MAESDPRRRTATDRTQFRAPLAQQGNASDAFTETAAAERQEEGLELVPEVLEDAIRHGAVLRVRPKAMTVAVIVAGLLPIFWGHGTESEVMSRIAAPMVGGMITAPLLSMFVIPAAYRLMRGRRRTPASARADTAS